MLSLYSRHLYVRIWLAVVAGVIVLMLAAGWLVRVSAENERDRINAIPREVIVRDANEQVIGTGQALRVRGQGGLEFELTLSDGRALSLQVVRRDPGAGGGAPGSGRPTPWRSPFDFSWMIVVVGLVVALGVYPIVRRLTKRLESLQRSVQRWGEGDLSVRVV